MSYDDRVTSAPKWVAQFEFVEDFIFEAETVTGMSTVILNIQGGICAGDLTRVIKALQETQKQILAHHKRLYGH